MRGQQLILTQTQFPILVQTKDGKRYLCSTPYDLPNGVLFKVIETQCDIEIRSSGLADRYPEQKVVI